MKSIDERLAKGREDAQVLELDGAAARGAEGFFQSVAHVATGEYAGGELAEVALEYLSLTASCPESEVEEYARGATIAHRLYARLEAAS